MNDLALLAGIEWLFHALVVKRSIPDANRPGIDPK